MTHFKCCKLDTILNYMYSVSCPLISSMPFNSMILIYRRIFIYRLMKFLRRVINNWFNSALHDVYSVLSEWLWKNFTGDSGVIWTHDQLLTSADVLTSRPPSLPNDDWPARILCTCTCSSRFRDIYRMMKFLRRVIFIYYINPPTIAALQVEIAVEVKISQLPVLTVDPNVHTGAFLTAFYCHFDQYKTMLLPVKNSRIILTCKCTYNVLHVRFECTR